MRDPRATDGIPSRSTKRAALITPAQKSSRKLAFYACLRVSADSRFTWAPQLMRTRHRRAYDCAQNLHPVRFNGDSLRNSKSNERESPDA
jgi:hypothetical protein